MEDSREQANGGRMGRDQIVVVVPSGLCADPFDENPFPETDPRHQLWKEATREAEKDIAKLRAGLLKEPCTSFLERVRSNMIETVTAFEIWTWRTLSAVINDASISGYDQWLLAYANAMIERAHAPQFSDLRHMIAERVEVRKAEARERAAQIESKPNKSSANGNSPEEPESTAPEAEENIRYPSAPAFNYKYPDDLPGAYQDTMKQEQRAADLDFESSKPISSMTFEESEENYKTWFWRMARAYDWVIYSQQPWSADRKRNEVYNYGLQAAAASLHLRGFDQFVKISESMEWALLNCNRSNGAPATNPNGATETKPEEPSGEDAGPAEAALSAAPPVVSKKRQGRKPGEPVDAGKLKRLRGNLSQEELVDKCQDVSLATIQRGEAGGRWDSKTFKRVTETLTLLTGQPVRPEDLKKPQ